MLPFLKKAISFVKKVFLIVAVYFVVINLFFYFIAKDKPTQTMEDPIEKNRVEIYKILNDPKSKNTKEGKATIAIYRYMMCAMIGEACTNNPADGDKNFNHSIFGHMANLIVLPYTNPPASGLYWAYSGLQNAGFVPKTYAAEGIGFAAIKPFAKIWGVFRDVSYMVLVLILIAIGFMIMFRMKINPQTIISVENALPRVVISLLLITFSFAIAGLLIDIMYIIIALGISVVAQADKTIDPLQLQNQYLNANFKDIWDSMFVKKTSVPFFGGLDQLFTTGNAIVGLLPQWINDSVRTFAALISFIAILNFIMEKMKISKFGDMLDNIDILGNSLGKITNPILNIGVTILVAAPLIALTLVNGAGWIVGILLLLTMLFLLFRIFFLLFTAYLRILLLIIFSPVIILINSIPGKNTFSFWIKSLVGDLLLFPLVIILLVLGRVLVNLSLSNQTWTPPFLYGIDASSFSIIVGMGLIFMIPDLAKSYKELLGLKGLPFSLSIGTFFGGVGTGVAGATGLLGQFSSIGLGLSAMGLSKRTGLFGIFGQLKPEYKAPSPAGEGTPAGIPETPKSG